MFTPNRQKSQLQYSTWGHLSRCWARLCHPIRKKSVSRKTYSVETWRGLRLTTRSILYLTRRYRKNRKLFVILPESTIITIFRLYRSRWRIILPKHLIHKLVNFGRMSFSQSSDSEKLSYIIISTKTYDTSWLKTMYQFMKLRKVKNDACKMYLIR